MKKQMLTILLIVVGMIIGAGGCKKEKIETKRQWFQGGNLHRATYGRWKIATYQNKLATASDWLAATLWKGHLNSYEDFDRIKMKAHKLVKLMDGIIDNSPKEQYDILAASVFVVFIRLPNNDLGPDFVDGITPSKKSISITEIPNKEKPYVAPRFAP